MEQSTNPTLAPYCQAGEVRFRVTACAKDEETASQMCDGMIDRVRATELARFIYGIDVDTLENAAVKALTARGWKVAVAESLTGGLIGMRLTSVPGASAVFLGGALTYQNEVKEQMLGVSRETLLRDTEISEACAREMAVGILQKLDADVAVSATGLAGPGGGTEETPVGTVFVGIAMKQTDADGNTAVRSSVRRLSLSPMRDRAYIRTVTASNAIEMLLRAAERGTLD